MDKRINLFFLFILLSLIIYGCKTTQKSATITEGKDEVEVINDDPKEMGEDEIIILEEVPSSPPEGASDEVMIRGDVPKAGKTKMADGAMAMSMSRSSSEGSTKIYNPNQPAPEAGQLTAGEWNDLHNWDEWKELLQDTDYNEMETYWELFPHQRYSIFVRNQYELPIQDARVDMYTDRGDLVWTTRTDNSGRAEMWVDLDKKSEKKALRYNAKITVDGRSHTIDDLKTIEAGVNNLELKNQCVSPKNVDVMFVVDATGSMGDEINYLQKELEDVITRSIASYRDLNVRVGSVFYRDSTDDYITKVQPLGEDVQATLDFISEQSAQGGGDYPEAVDAAMEEALAQDWSEDAIARIVFLLLDAPPHHTSQNLALIRQQIKDAAEEGIKIIPITASGINRQTEFLMKFMAIATNGTYVFMTDHSGIGNAHLDPVVQDYEVEKLNDLMVRLLYNYTKSNGCDANEQVSNEIKMYPNPATNFITLNTPRELDEVRLLSNSGMLIWSQSDVEKGELKIELGDLVDGVYTVQCRAEDYEFARPIIVINS